MGESPASGVWNDSNWLEYYKLCRDSTHNIAQKFLTLLFQLSTFAVGSVTLVGLLREKVKPAASIGVAIIAVVGTFYFALMLWRYFGIVRVLSLLCARVERDKLFGPNDAEKYGIFHVIDTQSSFYLSVGMRRVIAAYCATLLAGEIIVLVAITFELLSK